MKLYVINLNRAPGRLARISALLGELGVSFERVPAVDGNTLPPPPKDAPEDAHIMTRSEIALSQSHQKCWDLFGKSGDPYCVILEDDVHFGRDFAAFVTGNPPFPPGFDLVKIETTPFKIWLDKYSARVILGGRMLMRLASPHMGAAGYVLSRSGLEKVRKLVKEYQYPIDVILFGIPAKTLVVYQLSPSLVIQDNALRNRSANYAGLQGTVIRGRKPRVKGIKKIMREIARPFRGFWPPGPLSQKWRLSYGRVKFE